MISAGCLAFSLQARFGVFRKVYNVRSVSRSPKSRWTNCLQFTTPKPQKTRTHYAILSHPPQKTVPTARPIGCIDRRQPSRIGLAVAMLEPFIPSTGRQKGNRDLSVVSLNMLGLSAIRTVNGWAGSGDMVVKGWMGKGGWGV